MLNEQRIEGNLIISDYISNNIASTTYSPYDQLLEVEFKSGSVYSYHPVDDAMHIELMLAESQGKYFSAKIKNDPNITAELIRKGNRGR
jgi:hypothetical protein